MDRDRRRTPTRNGYAKAFQSFGASLPEGTRSVNPDKYPAVVLDPQPKKDYVTQLSHVKSINRHRRGFGRKITDFEQTLQALGARAYRVGQQLVPPEAEPHIPFLSFDETRSILRQYQDVGERLLREETGTEDDVCPEVPYSVHVIDNSVVARIAHQDWAEAGQIDDIRRKLGVGTVTMTQPYTDVPLVDFNVLQPKFAERVEQINRYDLTLTVGRLVLFRY